MCKKHFIILILMPFFLFSQHTIKGRIDQGENFSWVLLYKINDGKQIYVSQADVNDGVFEFNLSEKETPGMYRVLYQIIDQLYVEFIYNKENVNFIFNPENPTESIVFNNSDENTIYQKYYKKITSKQHKLDSLQVAYFNSNDSKLDKKINKYYHSKLKEISTIQFDFEDQTNGKLANHFIKVSKQYNAKNLVKDPKDYLNEVKKHFFDAVDFNNYFILKSTYINNKILDYIFYLNQSVDRNELNRMQKESINISLSKIDPSSVFKKTIVEAIASQYVVEQNSEMVNFTMENHYKKLPNSFQDTAFKQYVLSEVKTAIGKKAPNISWEENGVSKSLYNEKNSNTYIVVFFSSSCPHCQVEIPELHKLIKNISNIKVLAIGLEDEKIGWENMVKDYTKFTNILDLKKWDSKRVEDYGFHSIPSYFILDKEKIIVAKPENIEGLKLFFE
ncbi:MAG: TlpA family protein disulfide reductase [Flavobacteriaceae bacterium]|nr:TlpA family protein disulfide reductase [Flavobacteriaceae bacterium]